MKHAILFTLIISPLLFSYENLTPAQVHARLAAGDSLQLLDVREVSEYQDGHIAESAGMPIVVPANMPWSSGVLSANYEKLPKDIDIIVNCKSGGRSASASTFLESKGFGRIYNMTSGFNGWSYESRNGGYGDGSGSWVGSESVTIPCSEAPNSAAWNFHDGGAFPDTPRYIELHKVDAEHAPFKDLSDDAILFYTIVLDEFGLPVYKQILQLKVAVSLKFNLEYDLAKIWSLTEELEWFGGFMDLPGYTTVVSGELTRWYRVEPTAADHVARFFNPHSHELVKTFPNPFNGQLVIEAPQDATISIYDVRGRKITVVENNMWKPSAGISSGIYFVKVATQDRIDWKKVSYSR